jgi:magnesium transporter
MTPPAGRGASLFRDVQENVESSHFYADELLDDVNTVLNVQLALAAHRTGEVMRILTVFSVFFLPLTFVVGVYGMNFDLMPELHARWGYPAVLAAMGLITLMIYLWFRRRGWLRE